jgi:hypothetical protein
MRRALLVLAVAFSIAALAPSVLACHGGEKGKRHCSKNKPSADAATTQPSAAPDAPKTAPAVVAPVVVPPAAPTAAVPPTTPTPPAAAPSATPTDDKKYKVGDFGADEPEAGK